MKDKLLQMKHIVKIYGKDTTEIKALNGIDLEVEAGEMIAVMGASGSGKSTLLNILGAMDRPQEGEYIFYGEKESKVNELTNNQLPLFRKDNISFIFQGSNVQAYSKIYFIKK